MNKSTYEPPSISILGSVADATLNSVSGPCLDNNGKKKPNPSTGQC